MGFTVIAPVGDNLKALFIGMKEFPTDKVILLTPPSGRKAAKELTKKLDQFTIQSRIIHIDGNFMEGTFKIFGELCSHHEPDNLIVNVATGDRVSTCAALSAAFANGLKAFGVSDNKPMLMPIMKLRYYNELSDNKLKLLKYLKHDKFTSLKELNNKLKMSVSLLSYHINGNIRYKGLIEYRLVEVKEENKNLYVKLSDMGNLLLKGYIFPSDKKEV